MSPAEGFLIPATTHQTATHARTRSTHQSICIQFEHAVRTTKLTNPCASAGSQKARTVTPRFFIMGGESVYTSRHSPHSRALRVGFATSFRSSRSPSSAAMRTRSSAGASNPAACSGCTAARNSATMAASDGPDRGFSARGAPLCPPLRAVCFLLLPADAIIAGPPRTAVARKPATHGRDAACQQRAMSAQT